VVHLAAPAAPVASGPLLHIVQPNIGQEDKWQAGSYREQLLLLAQMSQSKAKALARIAGKPEPPLLLLWPEAAVTLPIQDERLDTYYQDRAAMVRQFLADVVGPRDLLLTGGVTMQSRDGIDATSATNSIFAVNGDGRILARYDKSHLVPYGEYLPMRPLLSSLGLSRLAPGDVDFDAGPGPQTLKLPMVGEAGFQLCYEIIFSGDVVDRRNRPAFLFNPSNDAWFGAWGPPQHLAQARLRALEEGLPVLRATPTGISAVIDSSGQLVRSLPWRAAGTIETQLPGPLPPTLFARLGNLLPFLFALLLAAAAIAVRRKAR
jgi:apolipoprotein N-acyltransferase